MSKYDKPLFDDQDKTVGYQMERWKDGAKRKATRVVSGALNDKETYNKNKEPKDKGDIEKLLGLSAQGLAGTAASLYAYNTLNKYQSVAAIPYAVSTLLAPHVSMNAHTIAKLTEAAKAGAIAYGANAAVDTADAAGEYGYSSKALEKGMKSGVPSAVSTGVSNFYGGMEGYIKGLVSGAITGKLSHLLEGF